MQPYEASFARRFGPDYYAFGFWKARVALYAILRALDLAESDDVVLPGYTCVVVPNSVRYAGARPVYADISSKTFNIDPDSVAQRITPHTRVVIAQHTYGIPAAMDELRAIAQQRGIFLVEDCAHVLVGSTYKNHLLGSLGDAAFFSFQWSKPYTTGLGGMAVTRDPKLVDALNHIQHEFQPPPSSKKFQLQFQYALFRRFFKPQLYWRSQQALHSLSRIGFLVGSSNQHELTGSKPDDFSWKMSSFQHRIGLTQLGDLEENSAHRETLAEFYLSSLRRLHWPIDESNNWQHVKLLRFPLEVDAKGKALRAARKARVEIGSWFESPLHPLTLEQHKAIDYTFGSCPVAESAAQHVINLPLHGRVTDDEAERIIRFISSYATPAKSRIRSA